MDPDPCIWTVDHVKQWATETFPIFGSSLAEALYANDVDGSILMEYVTDDTLKSDLGIKSLGQRVKALKKITELRKAKASLTARFDTKTNPPRTDETRLDFMTPFRVPHVLLREQSTQYNPIERSFSKPQVSATYPPRYEGPREFKLETHAGRLFLNNISGTPSSKFDNFRLQRLPMTPQTPISMQRQKSPVEHDFLDYTGDGMGDPMSPVSLPAVEDQSERMESVDESTLTQDTPLPTSTEEAVAISPPTKRPYLSTRESPSPRSPKRRKVHQEYFRTKQFTAKEVMFPSPDESDREADEQEYSIFNPQVSTGERLYVQGLMRKLFFKPDVIEFEHNDVLRTVWKLYPANLVEKHGQHEALVIDTNLETEEQNVFYAAVDTLDIPEDLNSQQSSRKKVEEVSENPFKEGDEWDYLEKWQDTADDILLPAFGDSDSEEVYDDKTLREIEEEERQRNGEPAEVSKPLPLEQVSEIIQEELQKFEQAWKEKELPKWERRAWKIYMKQHRKRTKKVALKKFSKELESVDARIAEYVKEYEEMHWKSVDELRRVCANCEESVYRRKELVWRIDLLTGKPPAKRVSEETDEDSQVDGQMEEVELEGENDELEESEEEAEPDADDFFIDEDEVENEMDGFIIGDDEIDEEMLIGAIPDEEVTEIVEEDDDIEESSNTTKTPKRKRKLLRVEDDTDTENEVPPNDSKDVMETDLPQVKNDPGSQKQVSNGPSGTSENSKSAGNIENDGEDSDIMITFGDREIADFCSKTLRSTTVATHFLLRTDGNLAKALDLYSTERESDRVRVSTESPKKPKKTPHSNRRIKEVQRRKEVVTIDSEESATPATESPAPKASTPKAPAPEAPTPDVPASRMPLTQLIDNTLEEANFALLRELVQNLSLAELFGILMNIAELVKAETISPATAPAGVELAGETKETCQVYWKIYLAYTIYVSGRPMFWRLNETQLMWLHSRENFDKFYEYLLQYSNVTPTPTLMPTEVVQSSSDVVDAGQSVPEKRKRGRPTKAKKKASKSKVRKEPKKSEALLNQESELRKIERRQEDQRKKGKLVSTTADGEVIINVGKKLAEEDVCLQPELAKKMKPHQIEGIQFIWRQVVMIPRGVGCLLAHTMGLGKTLQVIAFLITLSLHSSDANIAMPKRLRKDHRHYLILCPPGVVLNWQEEFRKWTPPDCKDALGGIYIVHQSQTIDQRLDVIRTWRADTGVLIMGYSQFRTLLTTTSKTLNKSDEFQEALLSLPDVVVADEAHEIRNPKSQIALLMGQIETGSRVALTGSPLSNHLQEYWAMMNWIHPGFLGSLRDFTTGYITPIKQGLYADSEEWERRQSVRYLEKLKRVLDGKILRKDISAIAEDLPDKTEFVIYLPLTPLQRKLYEKLVSKPAGSMDPEKHRQLFKWINMMRLICNHPYTLHLHVRKRQREEQKSLQRLAEATDANTSNDQSPADSRAMSPSAEDNDELPPVSALQWAVDIFDGMGNDRSKLMFTEFSNKTRVVISIVEQAIELKENVLIFIHSIPTLEYLAEKLRHRKLKIFVLTGATQMKDRQAEIKKFNGLKGAVYLISCRAGSLGLNITSANRVILFDLSWNPVHDQQAVGRAYRLGQRKHVFVYRLATFGTYEEIFFEDNIFKLNLSKRVIDKSNPGRHGTNRSKEMEKYFQPLKNDAAAPPIDRPMFENQDDVLDNMLRESDSGDGPKILALDFQDTFHKDVEETYLTAEDTLELDAEAEREKQLREEGKFIPGRWGYGYGVAKTLFPEDMDDVESILHNDGLTDLDIDVVGDDEERLSDTGRKPSDTKGKEVN